MGRVTFEGPVKSNGGFEVGEPGSKSSVAGTVVFSGSYPSVTLSVPNANVTTCTISGTLSLAGINITTGNIVLGVSSTVQTISIGPSSAITGWNNDATTISSPTILSGVSYSLNASVNSKFYFATKTTGAFTLTPVGGYEGQSIDLYWSCGTTTAIVFASSSSVQIRLTNVATGWAGLSGSLCSLSLLNMGPGVWVTPTTSNLWIEVGRVNDHSGIF